ncbi:hypothetical protein TNCT_452701 [Trichonephila clavata]|uniref:Uncharacterized protein n=1 Tax=Trichonephila clavata TaxID=2740835 RepID=A0A8X6HU43_TRICU|nr:hypothetical protein TNCT_452701 [Trichonephila clavata]
MEPHLIFKKKSLSSLWRPYVSRKERNHLQKCNLFSKSGRFISWTVCILSCRKLNSSAVFHADEWDTPSCTALFIGLFCKAVSPSAPFVFTMDALPDPFLSATNLVSRNRYTKRVIFDAFVAV